MRVKVHPHITKYLKGDPECVSVTPERPSKPVFYCSGVVLSRPFFRVHQSGHRRFCETQVRTVHAWMVGELNNEWHVPLEVNLDGYVKVKYDLFTGRFKTAAGSDVTDFKGFMQGVVIGKDLYVR